MRHYKLVDCATQLYLVVVGLLIACFGNERAPLWPFLLSGHVVGVLAIHVLILGHSRHPGSCVVGLLRHFYPVLLFTALCCETGLLNQMVVAGYLDRFFLRLEESLFGVQPGLVFMKWLPHLVVSELFYLSYFTFYVMVAGVAVALYVQDKGRFFHYVSILSFVFYVCYLIFILLPVAGPSVFWTKGPEFLAAHGLPPLRPTFPAAVQHGPFFRIMRSIYRRFEFPGGAFPSSHIAAAICTVCFSWRYLPRIRHVHLVAVVLLSVSTVYCRYHYVVDVIGGGLAAAALVPLAELLHKRYP